MTFAGSVLALAVSVLAGCGGTATKENVASANGAGGGATATAGASAGAADPDQARKFAQCVRENGVPDFPDPGADGRFKLGQFGRGDIDRDKMRKAMEACRDLAPNGGERPQLDAAQQEQLRVWAQCMRDNGVDIPDPDPNGGGFLGLGGGSEIDRDSPAFQKAMEACQDKFTFLPGGGA
jgi:hypothetical protein